MPKKMLKWIVLVVAILAIGGFWYWRANKEEPFVPRDLDTVADELKSQKQLGKYIGQLTEAYKNDFDGGDTPEETLNLFIAALKTGDTDLAAKYFILEKQEEMRGELRAGKEKGNLDFLLSYLEREKTGNEAAGGRYVFTIETSTGLMSFDLILNPYTRKWKIESL